MSVKLYLTFFNNNWRNLRRHRWLRWVRICVGRTTRSKKPNRSCPTPQPGRHWPSADDL